MHLFLASRPLQLTAMDIVELFSKTVQDSQYLFVIRDRYSKLAWAIQTLKSTVMHIMSVSMDH